MADRTPAPNTVLVVDEAQALFQGLNDAQTRQVIEDLIRDGRANGVLNGRLERVLKLQHPTAEQFEAALRETMGE